MPYATRRRILLHEYGDFTAVVHVMKCMDRKHGAFRPDSPNLLVPPHCTYANDVMVESAMSRFIDGRSCSEISGMLGNGISERHVRNRGNQALGIFREMHEENVPKLRNHMKSYILQIDGTTDSGFSMIVAVRDAISDFVLYVKRCDSESEESIVNVM